MIVTIIVLKIQDFLRLTLQLKLDTAIKTKIKLLTKNTDADTAVLAHYL